MLNIYKSFLLLIIIFFSYPANAHVEHYDKLSSIHFDIYRNNDHIGQHVFSFEKRDGLLFVDSEITFQIKKLGVVFYKYHVKGTEVYKDGQLIKFNSKTKQNKKDKYANITLSDDDEYLIDGSSYKGKAPKEYIIGTWWNHSIAKSKAQISAVSGRIINQNVTFLGKEDIVIDGKTYKSLHFNFSSTDKKLAKDKKLNTDVWYEEETLNWIKASFNKKGKWEYRLISIK
jgi:hypothetical protein